MLKTTSELALRTQPFSATEQEKRLPVLYRKFGPLIYSRCRRTLGNEALALQATQEVFVRVLRSLDGAAARGAVDALSSTCEDVCLELSAH